MEGLRESQRAQDEGSLSPDGTVDLPTPMIRGQVDRFLQVRLANAFRAGREGGRHGVPCPRNQNRTKIHQC